MKKTKQKRSKEPILNNQRQRHGWLILDKPKGMTSAQAVGRVRRGVGTKKVGHAGTLDPMATGVLPIAVGEATKTMPYMQDGEKSYTVTVLWGLTTDTLDMDGVITRTGGAVPEHAAITAALRAFIGTIQQRPPQFSAIKVQGQRAYALARKGEHVDLPPRPVTVHDLHIIAHDGATTTFHVACGKGFYVRALARDLAAALGTTGTLTALRRTRVGKFGLEHAISLDADGQMSHCAADLLPVAAALDDIPALTVPAEVARTLRQGQSIPLWQKTSWLAGFDPGAHTTVAVFAGETLVALTNPVKGSLKPCRVFNL